MRILVAGMVLVLTLAVGMIVAVNTDAQGQSGVTVFVDGSTVSSFSGSGSPWGGGSIGGTTEPQTIEVMKQLRRFCPRVLITANRAAAQYLVLHERQAEGTSGGNRNNIAVFGKNDLLVYADGARGLNNSVKDLCNSGVLSARPR